MPQWLDSLLKIADTLLAPSPAQSQQINQAINPNGKPWEQRGLSTDTAIEMLGKLSDYLSSLNIHEEGGDNKGPWVERFQKAVDGKAQGEPWCLAAVQFQFNPQSWKDSFFSSNPLASILLGYSPDQIGVLLDCFLPYCHKNLKQTELCMDLWQSTPEQFKSATPVKGAICIWQFNQSMQGHAGRVRAIDENGPGWMMTWEGNTSPSNATIEREGDGFYTKLRRYDIVNPKMTLKGFIVPWR